LRQQFELSQRLGASIIPIRPNSKAYDMVALRQRGYKTLVEAKRRGTRAPDLYAWFDDSGHTKKKNCGIITSQHLLIVDFDDTDTYWQFVAEYPVFANTYTVKSIRGYHCYYHTLEPISAITSKWEKVELFYGGRVILAEGSRIGTHIYKAGILKRVLTLHSALSLPMVEERKPDNAEAFPFRAPHNNLPSNETSLLKGGLYRGIIRDVKQQISTLELAQRYTILQDKGTYHLGRCPVHNDNHPSFRVAGGRATCAVPGCKLYDERALDVIELHSRINDLPYRDSIAILAKELGLINDNS
jgi:hypothetical protein